jgi:hypothetical protein
MSDLSIGGHATCNHFSLELGRPKQSSPTGVCVKWTVWYLGVWVKWIVWYKIFTVYLRRELVEEIAQKKEVYFCILDLVCDRYVGGKPSPLPQATPASWGLGFMLFLYAWDCFTGGRMVVEYSKGQSAEAIADGCGPWASQLPLIGSR